MNKGHKDTRHSVIGKLLPIILWILPVLALNVGFRFLARIELYWHEKSQQELARQELESLSVSSAFSYQLARHGGAFLKLIEAADKIPRREARMSFLQKHYASVFPRTFPQSMVFAFHQTDPQAKFKLDFANSDKVVGKRAWTMVFQHLVATSLNLPVANSIKRQRERILQKLFGRASKAEILGLSQRGKATHVLYERFPYWLAWDYREGPNNSIYGYFILTRSLPVNDSAAKLMALQECQRRGNGLAGFVPLIEGHGGSVLFAKLARSKIFHNWVRASLPKLDKDIFRWVEKGLPERIELGKYLAFAYLGKDDTHLSVFLIRKPALKNLPTWIWWINLTVLPLILLFSLRGILFNEWPRMRLAVRFLVLFALAASLPLSLVAVSASGYLYQFSFSSQDEVAANLKTCLNQFDARKLQVQEAYKVTSMQVFKDKKLIELIEENGINHDEVRDRVLSFFKNRADPLPLLGFYILDLAGKGLHYYEGTTAARLDFAFNVFKVPIIDTLRERFAKKYPEIQLPEFKVSEVQKFGELAYKSVADNDLGMEIERRRTQPISRRFGIHTATQMHDFLTINGRESAMIYIIWDDKSLDKRTLKATSDYLGLGFPTYAFVAFRVTPGGLEPIISPSRHIDSDFLRSAFAVAESSASRGGSVSRNTGKYNLLAKPSQKYQNTIIVGGVDRFYSKTELLKRMVILSLLILISLATIGLCAWLTSKFLVQPISELRSALEEVAEGNLDLQIVAQRSDELGNLSENFTSMVKGMKEREQLASLLSDQAIEAISGGQIETGKILPARSFEGVALVSDIRSFTTLCEQQNPDEITDLLNRHFAVMAAIITRNGGRIYKFIGDAIEAIFPEDDEDSAANRAMKAAVEMDCALGQINQERQRTGLFSYNFGVGLAKGTFYSGQIGSEETRIDYAVIGEPLSLAAELETASKGCIDLPIVVDDKIKEIFAGNLTFSELNKFSGAYVPDKASAEIQKIIFEFGDQMASDKPKGLNDLSAGQQKTVLAGKLTSGFKWGSMFLFAVYITILGALIILGLGNKFANDRSFKTMAAKESLFNLAEQLKSEASARTAFEMKMKRMIDRIESKVDWRPGPYDSRIVDKVFRSEIEDLAKNGFSTSRAIAFTFKQDTRGTQSTENILDTLCSYNISLEDQKVFQLLAGYKYNRFFGYGTNDLADGLRENAERIFGQSISPFMFSEELFGSAMAVSQNNRPEYFYWNFISVYDPEIYDISLAQRTTSLKGCPKDKIRIIGMVMLALPVEEVRNSPAFLVSGYDEEECDFALVNAADEVFYTRAFPKFPENQQLTYNSVLPELRDYVVNEQVLKLGEDKFRLVSMVKIGQSGFNLKTAGIIVFSLLLLLLLFFYISIFHNSFLSRSLRVQLWFSIIVIALIPLITVVFVIDLFLGEHQRTRVVQERIEMQRFLDSFELRQYFFKPVARNFLEKWSTNQVMVKAMQRFDEDPDCEVSYTAVNEYLQHEFASFNKPFGYSNNFMPRELFLIGKKGWQKIFANDSNRHASELSEVLAQIGRNILEQLQRSDGKMTMSAEKVKGEMYYEAGLATIRSSFGEDEAVRLSCVLNDLIELEVVTGAAVIYIRPMPTIEQPDYLLFWLTSYDSGNYLERLALNSKDRHAIFSIENFSYGILADPDRCLGDLGLEKIGAWISGSNLPYVEEQSFGKQTLLIEGRPGVAQFTNFLIAVAAKTAVFNEVSGLRFNFITLLLISIAVILLVAHHTAADIIAPILSLAEGMKHIEKQNFSFRINLDRQDELGELCQAYDHLARGLAEKEIMGKMLSQSAVNSLSSDAHTARENRRQYAFIFVGSPGFSSWLGTGTVTELFADLQKQTAQVCRIIADEGGDIDKIIGDRQLGIFSAETPQKAVESALRAARKLVMAEEMGDLPFPVAVGLNFGEVISGYIGVGNKRDFTVIGDAVNTTARIEKEAEKLRFKRCLFSENFIEKTLHKEEFRLHVEVQLKGKSTALKLFSII